MRMRGVSIAVALAALICLGGVSAYAQDAGSSKVDVSVDYSYLAHNLTSSACGGESFIECEDPGLQGFKIAGVFNLNRHVGVECNLAYHAGTHALVSYTEPGSYEDSTRERDNVTTFLCGPKITQPIGNFELFTHFLAGGMHVFASENYEESDSESPVEYAANAKGTVFGMEVGGGVDWVHKHWGVRLLEVDYVHGTGTVSGDCTVDCSSGGDNFTAIGSANDLQIAMGVNFRFGKR